MTVSKTKIARFVATREALKEVASGNDFNEEIADSIFFKPIGIKYIFALFKHDIKTVGDLIASDEQDVVHAINNSSNALTKITSSLRKIYISYVNIPSVESRCRTFIPDVYLSKTFLIINKMNKEQLAILIDLDNANNARLSNALAKASILSFQDIKDAGVVKMNSLHGLGRKSFKELYDITESFYYNKNQIADDVIEQFRDCLLNANSEVWENYDVSSLEERLYGYLGEFVDFLNLRRNGEIYKLRTSKNKATFEAIGKKYDLTRERVRQIVFMINNRVVYNFIDRKKAASISPINSFYNELCSIDKNVILYPIYLLSQKKDAIGKIILHHLYAVGLSFSQIVFIKPETERQKKLCKKRQSRIVPDKSLVKNVLSAVEANNGKWRVNKLADLLFGKFDAVFEKYFLNNRAFFGLCKTYTRSDIVGAIYYLLSERILAYLGGKTYYLYLTADGRMVLEHLRKLS